MFASAHHSACRTLPRRSSSRPSPTPRRHCIPGCPVDRTIATKKANTRRARQRGVDSVARITGGHRLARCTPRWSPRWSPPACPPARGATTPARADPPPRTAAGTLRCPALQWAAREVPSSRVFSNLRRAVRPRASPPRAAQPQCARGGGRRRTPACLLECGRLTISRFAALLSRFLWTPGGQPTNYS